MINNKSISYIIPAFNCANTIAESIESIFNNNFNQGDEVIIINDASTDNTAEKIEQLSKKYPLKILKHNINKGSAAAARNTGIDASKNNYLFCLDADNILEADSVKKLLTYMLEKDAQSAAFGELHFFSDKTKNVTRKWIFPEIIDLTFSLSTSKLPLSSGNYLFTRESWLMAKRYNESVGGAHDSWAFGISQLFTGTKMVTMPKSYYYHRHLYESTFVREVKKNNSSLLALQILLPYLHLIKPEDVEYIISPEHRYNWFDNLEQTPIKLINKTSDMPKTTKIINLNPSLKQKLKNRIISLIQKI